MRCRFYSHEAVMWLLYVIITTEEQNLFVNIISTIGHAGGELR